MKWDILWGKIEWQKQTGDDFLKKKKLCTVYTVYTFTYNKK